MGVDRAPNGGGLPLVKLGAAALAAVALAAAGLVAALQPHHHHHDAVGARVAPAEAPASGALTLGWTKGSRYVYDVRWTASSHALTPGINDGAIDGNVRFAAELSLSALGALEGASILSARLDRVTDHAIRVMGADAVPDEDAARTAFGDQEVWMRVLPDGRLGALYFRKDASPTFVHVMQSLLAQMQVELGGGGRAAWSATESSPQGSSEVAYEVTGQAPTTIARTRTRYTSLAALPGGCGDCVQALADTATIVVDPAGFLRAISETENLDATRPGDSAKALSTRTSFAAQWVRTESFAAPTDVSIDPSIVLTLGPGDVFVSRAATDAALAQRVGKMTATTAIAGIGVYERTGKLPSPDFVSRAAALVLQHPEVCNALVAKFDVADTKTAGRALVLDVLTSAGSAPAQAAMRDALGSRAAQSDKNAYPLLLQRFSMLGAPEGASLRFVASALEGARTRADASSASAAAYSLGALAGAASAKDPSAGRPYATILYSSLMDAKTPADRAVYLQALGNAAQKGESAGLSTFQVYAKDSEPTVRAAAASALRRDPSHDARATLDTLVADSDPDVQRAALSSLSQEPVDADDLRAMASELEGGALSPQNEGSLVTFLAQHANDEPASTRQMLGYLLAQADARSDRTSSVRIRTLLAEMP